MIAMDHTLKKAGTSKKADLSPISKACSMIKLVVDQHHMKLEDEEICPQFEDDPVLKNPASELKVRHDEARKMVFRTEKMSKAGDKADTAELKAVFLDFRDMMTAHVAREESVLFIAMQGTWSDDQLQGLKETQE